MLLEISNTINFTFVFKNNLGSLLNKFLINADIYKIKKNPPGIYFQVIPWLTTKGLSAFYQAQL